MKKAPESEYYAFCDQDDVWDDDKLLVAISRLEKFPFSIPAIYYCGQRLVDSNLNFIANHIIDNKRSDYTNYLISNVAGCTTVFNKKLLDIVNSQSPSFILMHDSWIYKVCLAMGGKYYADPMPHISYRQHSSNVTGIGKGIKAKFKQAYRYIYVFKIQKQIENLYLCYGDSMDDKYKELSLGICNYNKSLKSRYRLASNKAFNFNKKSLNLLVKLKIMFGKL